MPDHDFTTRYAEVDLGLVSASMTRRPSDDKIGILVDGACPRCSGRTSSEFRRGAPGSGVKGLLTRMRGRSSSDNDEIADEVFFCECGYPHPGQPADAVFIGCGASWRTALTIPADGSA